MFRASSIFVVILLYLALQFLTGSGDTSGGGSLNRIPGNPSGQEAAVTARMWAETTIPANDVYRLTAALRLKSAAPIGHVARTTALNEQAGNVKVFNLARFRERDYIPLTATLRLVTAHAYWYVDNG